MPCRALGTFPLGSLSIPLLLHLPVAMPCRALGTFPRGRCGSRGCRRTFPHRRNALSGSGDFSTWVDPQRPLIPQVVSQCPVGLWGLFHTAAGAAAYLLGVPSQCPVGLWGLFHKEKGTILVVPGEGRNALSGSGDFSTTAPWPTPASASYCRNALSGSGDFSTATKTSRCAGRVLCRNALSGSGDFSTGTSPFLSMGGNRVAMPCRALGTFPRAVF